LELSVKTLLIVKLQLDILYFSGDIHNYKCDFCTKYK